MVNNKNEIFENMLNEENRRLKLISDHYILKIEKRNKKIYFIKSYCYPEVFAKFYCFKKRTKKFYTLEKISFKDSDIVRNYQCCECPFNPENTLIKQKIFLLKHINVYDLQIHNWGDDHFKNFSGDIIFLYNLDKYDYVVFEEKNDIIYKLHCNDELINNEIFKKYDNYNKKNNDYKLIVVRITKRDKDDNPIDIDDKDEIQIQVQDDMGYDDHIFEVCVFESCIFNHFKKYYNIPNYDFRNTPPIDHIPTLNCCNCNKSE